MIPFPNRLFTYALILQLAFAFFMPPVPFGNRLLFGSDVWLFFWVAVFGAWSWATSSPLERRSDLKLAVLTGSVIGIVFLHGYGRPSLGVELNRYLPSPTDDLFSFSRELVVAGRFWAWCLGAIIVKRHQPNKKKVLNSLAFFSAIAALSLVASAISPALQAKFGEIYLYDLNSSPWSNRFFGVFRSPVEGSVTLSFAALVLLAAWDTSGTKKFGTIGIILLGLLFARTLSAPLSAAIALGFAYATTLRKKYFYSILFGIPAVVALVAIAFRNTAFFAEKQGNFLFRFKPWAIYLDSALSRFDRLLLGNGFHPHFSDNIYVFLFSRGGILLLGFALGLFILWWRRTGRLLSWASMALPIFFLLSGVTVDSLIIRPVVYVLICSGILALR